MKHRSWLEDKEDNPVSTGLKAGGLATAGLGTKNALETYLRELELEAMDRDTTWKAFQDKLQPGDLLFERSPSKGYEKNIMQALSGTNYPHVEAFLGKMGNEGRAFEARGGDKTAIEQVFIPPREAQRGYKIAAYRPDLTAEEVQKGLPRLDKIEGRKYDELPEMIKREANIFFGNKGGKCGRIPGGNIICSDIPHTAFPKLFPEVNDSVSGIMSKAGTPIAYLDTAKDEISAGQKALAHIPHGLLKALKPAAMVGGGVAAAAALAKFLRKHGEENDR